MPRLPDRLGGPELAGLTLLVVWVAWAAASAVLAERSLPPTSPYVASPIALIGGVVLGGHLGLRATTRATAWALLALASALLVGELSPAPILDLDYANANAALAIQLIGLCGLAMLGIEPGRRGWIVVAAIFAVAVVLVSRSVAGLAVMVPLLGLGVLMTLRPARSRAWTALAVFTGLVAATVAALGVVRLAQRADWPEWATASLDPTRQILWRDALTLWTAHPFAGAGPGAFQEFTPLGLDSDTASAHSSVLQVGAETGWVGLILFALIALGGLLWAQQGRAAYAVVASAAWTALLVHSFVDHLLDFPAVLLAAGMVLGWAAGADSEQLDVTHGEAPR